MLGSVLSVDGRQRRATLDQSRRQPAPARSSAAPQPVLASLRWPRRPELPAGNAAWTYMVEHPFGELRALRRRSRATTAAPPQPFEVWVNGAEQPRGLGALAKTLSMDLRANDPAWLELKLDALATVAEERPFEMPFPPHGERAPFPGVVAATAAVRALALRAARRVAAGRRRGHAGDRRACSHARSRRPALDGTLAWTVDIHNPATGDDFALTLKECMLPGRRWRAAGHAALRDGLSGTYPRALDGLARVLSLDMRVIDPAWIGMKLRKLLNYAEPLGHFMAFVPGRGSAAADLALDRRLPRAAGDPPLRDARRARRGAAIRCARWACCAAPQDGSAGREAPKLQAGRPCPECGNPTLIHKDGCDFCTACGYVGQCG